MQENLSKEIRSLLSKIIGDNTSLDAYSWLTKKVDSYLEEKREAILDMTFTAVPRKINRTEVVLSEDDSYMLRLLLPDFSIVGWTLDRLARVWLLLQIDPQDKAYYLKRIKGLFLQAEMNELVALYSALPVLEYPEEWEKQCAIGIRSNIGTVLEAIMYFNPYPSKWLKEGAWNQLVLKAFFANKDVTKIVGLDERANKDLALTLFDYVEERWSAHRTVNPQIWRLTARFIDEKHFYMLKKLFSGEETDKKVASLVCSAAPIAAVRELLEEYPDYKEKIEKKLLTWDTL